MQENEAAIKAKVRDIARKFQSYDLNHFMTDTAKRSLSSLISINKSSQRFLVSSIIALRVNALQCRGFVFLYYALVEYQQLRCKRALTRRVDADTAVKPRVCPQCGPLNDVLQRQLVRTPWESIGARVSMDVK